MLGAGTLRRAGASLVLAAAAAVGTAGCVLVPFPEPVGPPVVVAPRPVIIAPHRGHYHRGGWHGHGHRGHRGRGPHWR
jgi:hypothetical protein